MSKEGFPAELLEPITIGPYKSLESLRADCEQPQDPEWRDKMLHPIPDAPVVDRVAFILERCKGRKVLNIGSASGGLHEAIRGVAAECWGVDKETGADIVCDVDKDQLMPPDNPPTDMASIQLVVMGEILEHLTNPGELLWQIRRYFDGALITVPNAYAVSRTWAHKGIECVNRDHVAWYTPHTLRVLVERYGFEVAEFAWYGERPGGKWMSEGLIFVVR